MALTTYVISQSSDHLGEAEVQYLLYLFRKSDAYRQYAYIYSIDLEERITDTEGTYKARMLNAVIKEVDDLGTGEVHIGGDQRTIGAGAGDREGTHWSQPIEREALISDALAILFDDISTMIMPSGSIVLDGGVSMRSHVAVGQRDISLLCTVCNVTYTHINGVRSCLCH